LVTLSDTNDEFTIVTAGIAEGDRVVLDPLAYVEEAQQQATQSPSEEESAERAIEVAVTVAGDKRAGAGMSAAPAKARQSVERRVD
jgi:hypothetical protein